MKKIQFIVIYEIDCGGETEATENIIAHLQNNETTSLRKLQLQPLVNTSSKEYFLWLMRSINKTYKFLKNEKIETQGVIYTTSFTAGFAAFIFGLKNNISLIFHYHGNRIPTFERKFTQLLKYFSSYLLHKLVFHYVRTIIVPSDYTKKKLLVQFPLISGKKIVVIENGIDTQKFHRYTYVEKINSRKKYGLKKHETVITNISRLVDKKGVIKLLLTFCLLQKKHSNLHLLFAYPVIKNSSEMKYKNKIISIINSKKIKPVTLIENANMPEIYNISDLVVSFSEEENYPLVLLESYATNTRFVATNKETIKLQKTLSRKNRSDLSWSTVTNKIVNLIQVINRKDFRP